MWFERLMGFAEASPEQVRANITHEGEFLVSRINGRRVRCGRLETPSLAELRRVTRDDDAGNASVCEVVGDVGQLHRDPAHAGALFQAASQFNLLEMAGPEVTPEEGVGIYEHDHTQGPACAVACGGGTILRNYFATVSDPFGRPTDRNDELGQTAERQIDCLAELGDALGQPGQRGRDLWQMKNGYALATAAGLERIDKRVATATEQERDELRGLLRIGVMYDVEVLGCEHLVTQVYGSALPVAYGEPPSARWESFARLVLEASYEATLLVARQRQIATVFLTLLGGGVFGNQDDWIEDAVLRALARAGAMDVRIVSYGRPHTAVGRIVQAHGARVA